jgi:hypothetical protein
MDGDTRVFDELPNYNISPVPSGTGKETEVFASGTVSITPNNNQEFYVMLFENGPPSKYVLYVYTDDPKTNSEAVLKETIKIDAALVDQIDLTAIDPFRLETQDLSSEQMGKIKGGASSNWPSKEDLRANLPNDMNDNDRGMLDFLDLIDIAMNSDSPTDASLAWGDVKTWMAGHHYENLNDCIRTLLDVLNKMDPEKFDSMLKLIPPGVREAMANELLTTPQDGSTPVVWKPGENHDGGDGTLMFTNQQVYDLLMGSLTE